MNSITQYQYFSAAVSSQILLFLVSHVNWEDVIILMPHRSSDCSLHRHVHVGALGMGILGILHHPSTSWRWRSSSWRLSLKQEHFLQEIGEQESIHSCMVTCGSVAPTSSTVRTFFLARASSLQDFNGNSVLSCNTGEKFPSQSSQPLQRGSMSQAGLIHISARWRDL